MNNKWAYNISNSDTWTSDLYERKDDCIADAIEEALESGKGTFNIGIAKSVGLLHIDGQSTIEGLQEHMHELVGEISETYLECATKQDIDELGKLLTSTFHQWCKDKKICDGEEYYTIENEEIIKYCASCKSVIASEDDSSDLIQINGEYIVEEYFFHKECNFVPNT